ncbi:FeoB-associated Cys-rich membrane protein [Gallibacterium salpingitidis]|nr:FeoB-associated Cys-rich membrane protein [Gallibacterium salpingitidis]WKS99986.1 FeoB-associated Cys-rich membrane protein [Gallibacterium salpingitidis]
MIQYLIVAGLFIGAIAYLIYHFKQKRAKGNSCGDCCRCGTSTKQKSCH